MKQSELIKTISEQTDINENRIYDVIKAFKETLFTTLKANEPVIIEGLGKFYATDYKEREIITPQGLRIHKEACKSPRFKTSAVFRDYLNN